MNLPRIESYRFGQIVVDAQSYTKDLIILPGGISSGWWRQEGHALHPADLDTVFEAKPDLLVVGQGANGLMRVTPAAFQALQAAGIELIALPTGEACQTYNRLRTERRVVAALHLTC